ncbi:MAG TPA: hypothetical protein ENN53_05630 [Candidatus Acetothermia bacterium]|nr:hypothetical protein [Candidatus Acetothermia bacterium]
METLEQDLSRLVDGYRRAIERALECVPVRNGVVSLRDLWIETALPMELIADLLQADGIQIPPHIVRVDLAPPPRKDRHGRKR